MEFVICDPVIIDGEHRLEYFKESSGGGFSTTWTSDVSAARTFDREEDAQHILDKELRRSSFPRCYIAPKNPEPLAGDTVYLRIVSRSNTARRAVKDKSDPDQYVRAGTVTKIGRKYLTVSVPSVFDELRFRLDNHLQDDDQIDYVLFRTRQTAIEDVKGELLWQTICQAISGHAFNRPHFRDIETIARILDLAPPYSDPEAKQKGEA